MVTIAIKISYPIFKIQITQPSPTKQSTNCTHISGPLLWQWDWGLRWNNDRLVEPLSPCYDAKSLLQIPIYLIIIMDKKWWSYAWTSVTRRWILKMRTHSKIWWPLVSSYINRAIPLIRNILFFLFKGSFIEHDEFH